MRTSYVREFVRGTSVGHGVTPEDRGWYVAGEYCRTAAEFTPAARELVRRLAGKLSPR